MARRSTWVYDLETSPNFFSGVFKNIHTKEIRIFMGWDKTYPIWPDRLRTSLIGKDYDIEIETIADMEEFMYESKPILIGFNSLNFDNVLVNYWLEDGATLHGCYNIAQSIVNSNKGYYNAYSPRSGFRKVLLPDGEPYETKLLRWKKELPYDSFDLMKLVESNNIRVGLKTIMMQLRWPMLKDLPYGYDYCIQKPSEVLEFLRYNLNDVLATEHLMEIKRDTLKMRIAVAGEFGVDPYDGVNCSDSSLCNKILTKMWGGEPEVQQTLYKSIPVKDCIGANIRFLTDEMKLLLSVLESITLSENPAGMAELEKFNPRYSTDGKKAFIGDCIEINLATAFGAWRFKLRFTFDGTAYDIGVGGLHSADNLKPGIWRSDDKADLIDADVTSYYPSIIVNNNIYPQHLGPIFVERYRQMMNERVEVKENGDDIKSAGLKITINGGFGKFNSKYFWLYDKKCMFSTTISGQLYLLDLIEKLSIVGIHCISANTDGILCVVPKIAKRTYDKVCMDWEARTNLGLEFAKYLVYGRRDVNNYFAQKEGGKVKTKGAFDDNSYSDLSRRVMHRGYSPVIVQHAVLDYFLNDTPVEETIFECDDIYKFINTQRVGSQFDQFIETATVEVFKKPERIPLQKNNRYIYYSGNNDDHLYGMYRKEHKANKGITSVYAGGTVRILNDIPNESISEMGIGYGVYIEEARKLIRSVVGNEVRQLTLF